MVKSEGRGRIFVCAQRLQAAVEDVVRRKLRSMSKRAGFSSLVGSLALVSATFAGGGSSGAQQIGNAEEGRRLAQVDCAQCHGVDRDSYSSNPAAPTFDDIANIPGMTGRALIVALRTSHRSMPNLVVKDRDAENLVAHILSLKRN
jgi:mono/diheme cytochrome c family protein